MFKLIWPLLYVSHVTIWMHIIVNENGWVCVFAVGRSHIHQAYPTHVHTQALPVEPSNSFMRK